jgi:hypothetical protein
MGIELIQILLLSLIFFSLLKKKSVLFISAVSIQILLYDVLSVYSAETLPLWIRWPLKGWQELIFAFSLFMVLRDRKRLPLSAGVFFLLATIGLITGLLNGNPPDQLIQGFRLYLLLPFSLYLLFESRIFRELNALIPAGIFLGFCVLSVLYSLWLDHQFDGNLRILWFYDFVDKIHPVELARFNYIRNGGLRACGFFISPLIQSAALGFASLLGFCFFIQPQKSFLINVLTSLIVVLFTLGLFYCRTRIGWIIFSGGLLQWLAWPLLKKFRNFAPFIVPGLFVAITFAWLLSGFSSEPSANGRLDQYALLFEKFRFAGYGFGHPLTMTVFDSFIISSALLFGVFSVFYFLLPLQVCNQLNGIQNGFANPETRHSEGLVFHPVLSFSSMMLYMMVFQFTNGGPVISLFYWFAFILISNHKHRVEGA